MPGLPDSGTLLLAASAAGGAIGLALFAAVLLAQGAEDRDVGRRMRGLLQPDAAGEARRAARGVREGLARPVLRVGEWLRDSAIVSPREIEDFRRAMTAAGIEAGWAVPFFLGAKAFALLTMPLAALGLAWAQEMDQTQTSLAVVGALVLAVILPNRLLDWLRRPFQEQLRRGLPDALDLLVVAAEAGLALETAVDRVAREMEGSNRAIAGEMNTLLQELRMLPDRRLALERMAERTDLEGFRRLGTTLSQTLRYGTPLAQALRALAADMRQERMLRLEEKAIKLPAKLIGPLILFILPALFIALLGPSILEIGKSLGGSP
jgi:tight adherence protein C